jgi:cytochrome c oxidase cbb3-type subunit III
MSDFVSISWHWFVAIVSLISIIGCGVLLWTQTTKRPAKGETVKLHGNVWDEDLVEYNHPMPSWWIWLFYITIVFSLGYLVVYPGLGNFVGSFGWTSTGQYQQEMKQAEAEFGPVFAKHAEIDVATLSKDAQAVAVGQRLFLNHCAQCHSSDAGGSKGFPNLRDKDWLYGGDPATIEASITNGRNGIMPALGLAIGGDLGVTEMAQYVRSMSGLKHDAVQAAAAAPKFAVCAACHGADGKGNRQLGAPNLTDEVWLYGSSAEEIAYTIKNGRGTNQLVVGQSAMPAQGGKLSSAKIHLLTAYVYSLGGGEPPVAVSGVLSTAVDMSIAPAAEPVKVDTKK